MVKQAVPDGHPATPRRVALRGVRRLRPPVLLEQRRPHEPLSQEEQRALESVRKLAWLMDARWGAGPVRFGLESVIGLVPGAGDGVSAVTALYQVLVAARLGVPLSGLTRMLTNTGLDLVIGIVPVLGDVADTFFKAHLRNLAIIEAHIQSREQTAEPQTVIPVRRRSD